MNAQSTMKASELYTRATKYADLMIAELGVLNKQYPHADMNPEEERVFLSNCGKDFSVDLEKLRFALEGTFCQYIASHFVILPED